MTSTSNEEQALILKTDALGRVRMPKDRREAILDAFERSGMSGQAFATRIGVKYPTFATWVQKRRRSRGDYKSREGKRKRAAEVTLFEAVVDPEATTAAEGALEVETAQGLKLRIGSSADVALAAELLQALEGAKGC
jgi:transposase